MRPSSTLDLLGASIAARQTWLDPPHEKAFRLFNGFTEGIPGLAIDIYARSAVIYDSMADLDQSRAIITEIGQYILDNLNWLRAILVKSRKSGTSEERRGKLIFGKSTDTKVKEYDIWYTINLTLNRDASLYLDTRNLRKWLIEHSSGKTILNTFAYTGSLGVAAKAGGAARVVQHDLNRQFLNMAKSSYTLNGFPIFKEDFVTADFFTLVGKLKRAGETFDGILIDPPFFSTTSRGRVDQARESDRLINKVRPLIRDGGNLVAVNNALYISGAEYLKTLETLCVDGYLEIKELIPVPQDFVGFKKVGDPITDPSPFNHSTKIVIMGIRRK